MPVHFKCFEVQSWFLQQFLGEFIISELRIFIEHQLNFSVAFLRKKLTASHWIGIISVVCGLAVVGVSDIIFSKVPEGGHTNTQKIAGDALILIGMLFTSFQVILR